MTKKILWMNIIIITSIIAILIARGVFLHGDVSNYEVDYGKSKLYTREELEYAINTVKDYFKEHFAGCKLMEIRYGGDNNAEGQNLSDINANRNHSKYNKLMVLYVNFKTDNSQYNSFEPNHLYTDFVFVLASSKGNKWDILTSGYA